MEGYRLGIKHLGTECVLGLIGESFFLGKGLYEVVFEWHGSGARNVRAN